MRSKSWYRELSNRAATYECTSYPYTSEKLGQARVIKELKTSLWELLDEIEKQADEIANLKELLEREQKSKEPRAKKLHKCNER